MNAGLTPALLAAGGGSVLMGGIVAFERRRDQVMRASMQQFGLRFPAGLEAARALAALDALSGLTHTSELIFETTGTDGRVTHRVWLPKATREPVVSALAGVLPAVRLDAVDESPRGRATVAFRLFIPTPVLLSADGATAASDALLSGLTRTQSGERVVLRWVLRGGGPPRWQPSGDPDPAMRAVERAWRRKVATPGFSVSGLVIVRARSVARARALAGLLETSLASRRALAGRIRLTREFANGSMAARPETKRSSGWLSTSELLPLLGWPLGDQVPQGVEVGATRQMLVPRHVPRRGRVLFTGHDAAGDRPVALDATASRHHVGVVGPSGVGKSVLLARAALSDIEHGYGGVLVDPKADLVEAILARVKPEHADRIVVLDPADARPTPGLSLLSIGDADLRTEVIVGTLKTIFAEAWGVRSDFYLRLAFRTLAEVPGASLSDIGRLFSDPTFRASAIGRLQDPYIIASWRGFESLSANAQAEHVQAPMARIMALLSRPGIRAVLASPDPRLDVARLLRERKWLLASLAPGRLGESGAAIIGASLMYAVWSAIEARVSLAPEKRHPVFVYVDEVATLTGGLPIGLELAAERFRGLGAGLVVAAQSLGRIPEPTRGALLGNLATLIAFRTNAEEAPRLARELPGLTAADLMALDRFAVAARLSTGVGGAVSIITGRTEPLPTKTGLADEIRDRSAARYAARFSPPTSPVEPPEEGPLGVERRQA